ncbi:flagellar basal body P-ring formation chaperone FlgA [Methylopila henanensis]|uniref:Flagellar basal body P-ring formation chaperone FlgA n=1 Tax=Methylopila henanensis TaxID=873516 RepID=A0ABW4K6G1_9HYPH
MTRPLAFRLAPPLLIAAALSAAATFATSARAQPTLRAEALVVSDVVTLGDLIEDADIRSGAALFRAPDLGKTGTVPAAVVIEAARRAGVADVIAGSITEIAVTRLSREIGEAELTGAVAARAADELGARAEDLRVTLDAPGPLHLDPSAPERLAIERFVVDRRSGRFEAVVTAGTRAAPRRLTGSAVETVEVTLAGRALARGDVIGDADLVVERRPRAQNPDAMTPAEARGLAARRSLREGQPLRDSDLMRPQHVDRGAFVTLVYASGGMSLSLKAKALQSGAQGDLVSVQNLQSRRTVSGVVTGPSEVTVTAAPTAVARR